MSTIEGDPELQDSQPDSANKEERVKSTERKEKKKKKAKKAKQEDCSEASSKEEKKRKKKKKNKVASGDEAEHDTPRKPKKKKPGSKAKKTPKDKEARRQQQLLRRASVAEAAPSTALWLKAVKDNKMAEARDISVLLMFCMIYEADLPISFYEQLNESVQLKNSLKKAFSKMSASEFFKHYSQ